MRARTVSTAAAAIALPVASKRPEMKGAKAAAAIEPSSVALALRQNGSLRSLKILCITCRLLPR